MIQRTDLFSGLTVSIIGIAAFIEALGMPRFAERGADPFTVPGLTPGIVSGVIALLGLVLVVRSILGTGERSVPITNWPTGAMIRTLFTVVAVLIYGIGLFGRVPFIPATAAFVFAFTFVAEWLNHDRKLSLPILAVYAAVLGLVAGYFIHYVFTDLFLVRLPG